jgi:hypothetical protein
MSDIKIIKVATGGASKVDSSGFFIKPKQQEPSHLSQFIQKEKKQKRDDYEDEEEEDKESVDSMTVSDVSSATQQSQDEEYTNESMTPAPLPLISSSTDKVSAPRISSIIKDETLNSYLEKPKVEQSSTESLNMSSTPISTNETVAPISPQKVNNITGNDNDQINNNARSTTAQPANRNDYYSDTEEDVIDMTDNKLYDILASVLEDEDGENVSENMSKMNRNIEKIITMFEAYQQNNTKDEYLSKIGEAIENQNKILSQIVRILEKQGQPNQEGNVVVLNEIKENNEKKEKQNEIQNESQNNNENEKNKKNKKNEKQKSSSESSSESDKGENTNDTENTNDPNIKKVKISESLKHSTLSSKKEIPLKHRIQIKRKT